MRVLRARLYERGQAERDAELSGQPALAARSGDRSEKVRTYNYPQNRVTDHRVGVTLPCGSRCWRVSSGRSPRPCGPRSAGGGWRSRTEIRVLPTPTCCAPSSWASPCASTRSSCRARTWPLLRRVSDRYGLTRLEYHSDGGATFSGPDGAEFVLRPAQMASCGVTGLGYREGLERVGGLIDEAIDRYGIGPIWVEDMTLVAIWDIEDEDAGRLLMENILRVDEERLELLGGEDLRSGLRIWRRSARAPWSARSSPCTPSRPRSTSAWSRPARGHRPAALLAAGDAVHDFLRAPSRRSWWRAPAADAPDGGRSCAAPRATWPSGLALAPPRRRAAAGARPRGRADALYTDSERPLTPPEPTRSAPWSPAAGAASRSPTSRASAPSGASGWRSGRPCWCPGPRPRCWWSGRSRSPRRRGACWTGAPAAAPWRSPWPASGRTCG